MITNCSNRYSLENGPGGQQKIVEWHRVRVNEHRKQYEN